MPTHARAKRPFWLLVLCLQLALPGLATVADARVDARARAAGSHVESLTHPCDAAPHPQQCAFCQFAGAHGQLPVGATLPPLPAPRTAGTIPASTTPPPAAATCAALPRGPPSVV